MILEKTANFKGQIKSLENKRSPVSLKKSIDLSVFSKVVNSLLTFYPEFRNLLIVRKQSACSPVIHKNKGGISCSLGD